MSPWKRIFALFFLGQSLSLVGSALTQFVLMWWITSHIGTSKALALAALAGLLPLALLGPVAGVLVDRWNRKLVLILTDGVSALCLGALALALSRGAASLELMLTLLAIRGAMQAFQAPAAKATVPLLVPESFLPRASGFHQIVEGLMTLGAAPLGALVLAWLPLHQALLIDVVTAAIAMGVVAWLPIPSPRPAKVATSWKEDLVEGWRTVRQHPGLMQALALETLVVAMVFPVLALVPLFVTQHLRGGLPEVATFEVLSGLGLLAGGLLASLLGERLMSMRKVLVLFATACAAIPLCAAGSHLLWAAGWWGLSAFAYALGSAPFTALLQRAVPPEVQGRVFALLNTAHALAAPLGLLVLGPLGDLGGVRAVYLLAGTLATVPYLVALASTALAHLGAAPSAILDE